MSVGDKLAKLFTIGPLGSLRTGRPRLLRLPLSQALLGGGTAILVLAAALAAIWWLGKPGRLVERALLTWLSVDYLRTSFRMHPEPEADLGDAGGLVNAPWRWSDDGNAMLMTMAVLLWPGKWLMTRAAGLIWRRQLPTVEQLAALLLKESESGHLDYELEPTRPSSLKGRDPGADFATSLRRSRSTAMASIGLVMVTGVSGWFGFTHGLSGACAIAAFLMVELFVRTLRAQATLGHPDLLHLWASRRRPELAEQGRQVVHVQAALAEFALRASLAAGLAWLIAGFGPT